MSNVTPPGGAGASSVRVKVKVVEPRSPSVGERSPIDSPTRAAMSVAEDEEERDDARQQAEPDTPNLHADSLANLDREMPPESRFATMRMGSREGRRLSPRTPGLSKGPPGTRRPLPWSSRRPLSLTF